MVGHEALENLEFLTPGICYNLLCPATHPIPNIRLLRIIYAKGSIVRRYFGSPHIEILMALGGIIVVEPDILAGSASHAIPRCRLHLDKLRMILQLAPPN